MEFNGKIILKNIISAVKKVKFNRFQAFQCSFLKHRAKNNFILTTLHIGMMALLDLLVSLFITTHTELFQNIHKRPLNQIIQS